MKLILFSLLLVISASVAASADPKKPMTITPRLGGEFGKIIEIEGKIVDDSDTRQRAHLGKQLIEVQHIGDEKLEEPLVIEIYTFSFTDTKLPKRGTRVKLRGYETGGFSGIPRDAFKDIPSVATTNHFFKSYFMVTKLISPSEPKLKQETKRQNKSQ